MRRVVVVRGRGGWLSLPVRLIAGTAVFLLALCLVAAVVAAATCVAVVVVVVLLAQRLFARSGDTR